MKQRSTTPVSKGLITKYCIVTIAVLMAVAGPLSTMPRAHADQYDDQINALQSQINQYRGQANALQTQIGSLQAAVGALEAQKNAIQAQIDLNQAKLAQLQQQIKDTTQKISDNKDALGETIAGMYVDDSISPLEMLASSKNIGDYVDKQSYRTSVSDQLKHTIDEINKLKAKLDKDKASVEDVLASQQVQRDALAANQQEQQKLLDQTKGQEAAYQQLVASSQQKLESVADQQRAFYESLVAHGGSSSGVSGSFQWQNLSPSNGGTGCGGGGYTYCQAADTVVDEWKLYNRECVSYVAWALQYRFGRAVAPFHGDGNAEDWPSSAPRWSRAQRVYDPQPGDAVILPADYNFAPIGHAMIVESSSGGWIHVSQYNMFGNHGYSTMDIRNSGIILLRFPPA